MGSADDTIDGVIIIDKKSGIPMFSNLGDESIDDSLFSAFVAAVGHFASELSIGGLTSFTTNDKTVFIASREKTITALVTPRSIEFQEKYSLAHEIGETFESRYSVPTMPQPENYSEFGMVVDDRLSRRRNPFLRRVASFARNEFGGSVSIGPQLMKRDGTDAVIDIIVDNGCKQKAENNGKYSVIFNQDVSIFKVVDGTVDRGEILDFVELASNLGMRVVKKDEMYIIPYAPHRAIIVGRDFTSSGLKEVMAMPHNEERIDLDFSYIYKGIKSAPKEAICHVALYRWNDEREPDKIIV